MNLKFNFLNSCRYRWNP